MDQPSTEQLETQQADPARRSYLPGLYWASPFFTSSASGQPQSWKTWA
jgi:hypothetical protein